MKKQLAPDLSLGPVPTTIMSLGEGENANLIAIAWTGLINNVPPMTYVALNPARYSTPILEETGEFVLNMVDADLLTAADYTGSVSGRDADKWEKTGLTQEPAKVVGCDAVAEAPVQYECVVRQTLDLPSHKVFIAEIVNINADESVLDENGLIDPAKTGFVSYFNGKYVQLKGELAGVMNFSLDVIK